MINNHIEQEYSFIITRRSLEISIPKQIKNFLLEEKECLLVKDVLIERKNFLLKNEWIGVRARRVNNCYKLTCKKFLGKRNGLKRFNELDIALSEDEFEEIENNNLDKINTELKELLGNNSDYFVFLEIQNKRTVYIFGDGEVTLKLFVEDLVYKNDNNNIKDAMIEVEVFSDKKEILPKSIQEIVNYLKELFDAKECAVGKGERGRKLLNGNSK